MHFGNSAGNFGGSAVRRQVGHDSAAAMSKLVALLPNCMQIVQNWSEKGVMRCIDLVDERARQIRRPESIYTFFRPI